MDTGSTHGDEDKLVRNFTDQEMGSGVQPADPHVRNFTDAEVASGVGLDAPVHQHEHQHLPGSPPRTPPPAPAGAHSYELRLLAFRGVDLFDLFRYGVDGDLETVERIGAERSGRREVVRAEIWKGDQLVRVLDKRRPEAIKRWMERTGLGR